MPLQHRLDLLFGDSEDHHLVIGEQILLDGTREGEPMELRPIGRRIIHREDLDRVIGRLGLGRLGIEPGVAVR